MAQISVNDLRRGKVFKYEGKMYVITFAQHVKPGKGVAFMKVKMKNLESGGTIENNFRSNEKVEEVYIESAQMQYSYSSGDEFTFIDEKSYEQMTVSKDAIGDSVGFLKEGMVCSVELYEGKPISIELPAHVVLKIESTEPGAKGDTVSNVMKPAVLETGAEIRVPLFVNEGDYVKVDTRDGSYIERAK